MRQSYSTADVVGFLEVPYSQKPAAEVFRFVLSQPVPAGVQNLRIAGHGVLMQHTVWMTFTVPDTAMEQMLKSRSLTIQKRDTSLPEELKAAAATNEDARSLHWENALRLQNKDTFNFYTATGGSGWNGYILVDRHDHEIYVVADLL